MAESEEPIASGIPAVTALAVAAAAAVVGGRADEAPLKMA